jgi:hypothetical protein
MAGVMGIKLEKGKKKKVVLKGTKHYAKGTKR